MGSVQRPRPVVSDRTRLFARSGALILLLGATWLVVGVSLRDASTAAVAAGRTGFTVLGLAALTWRTAPVGTPALRAYRWWQIVILAGTGVTAYTVFSTVAIALAGPALPSLVLCLAPAVVLVAESVLARARPPLLTVAGTAVAVAGAAAYVVPRLAGTFGRDVTLGTVCAVAAMLSIAFYGLFFARVNRGYHGAMAPRILPIFAAGSIPLIAWAVVEGAAVSLTAVGLLAILGIVIYVPAYLLQHRILVTAGASYSALLGLGVPPLVGVGSALVHLGATPTPVQAGATVVTLAGMVLVISRQ
ncbi:DMT family transporter [Winogradskya humida]|uniref:EamA-like transporter family protein n=1 Tax=Winogradskya humida TaxID=113566 RepID=A0ABQ4A5U4_9ACTN|nr:DMT family transporter [Actinoplanes humidus]GIE26226.1 hypothetical protein Ahu01nite_093280 [Actinoplanes humidus]